MSIRNRILVDIVTANGGTVTDPNNRNQLLRDWLLAVGGGITSRYFIDLDPVANADYSIGAPLVSGDFEMCCNSFFDGSSLVRVWGNGATLNSRLIINVNGSIEWRPANDSSSGLLSPSGSVSLLGLNKIRVVRVGAAGEIFVNGVSVISGGVPIGLTSINKLGSQGGHYSAAILSDPEFIGSVTTASWRLDEPAVNTEENIEGGNTLTYNNITTAKREEYELNQAEARWDNIAPLPQELPAIIEIA